MNVDLFKTVASQLFNKFVYTGSGTIQVGRTSVQGLRQVKFNDSGKTVLAVEQNPNTGSKYAVAAQAGHKVVQFIDPSSSKYLAVSVDGVVEPYGQKQ